MIGSFRLPVSLTSSVDTTAPTILSATVEDANPDKLVVVFSEVVDITDITGLTITGDATPTLSAPTGTGSDTITLTLSTVLTNGQSVTLNVSSSNTIEDAANNSLAATTQAVINNVAAVSSYEAETTAYMNAVGIPNDTTVYYATTPQEITGAAMWTAIDNYVKALKDNLIYSKFKAIYPLIGDTALQMKWNLKNPLDTDAAFRLAFFGSGILSATGWKGNGSNAYLETFLNQSTETTLNSESVGYYARTSSAIGNDAGIIGNGLVGTTLIVRTGVTGFRNQGNSETAIALTNLTGLIAVSRTDSTGYKVQSRDNLFTVSTASTSLINGSFTLGKIGGQSAGFSDREYSFSYISEGLTDAELLAHNTAVENLQTALKRNVA